MNFLYFLTAVSSAFAPNVRNVLFLSKNYEFYQTFEDVIIESNIDSKVDFNDDFTKETIHTLLLNNEYDYVVSHDIRIDDIGVIVQHMNECGTNNFISLSSENMLNFGVNSVEGLCDHFNITYCDIKYNALTKNEPTEKVGVYYDKSMDFILSSISEQDLADFCSECVIDGKNPYLDEIIYVKEAKEGDLDMEIAENNDVVSQYSEWFALFPKEKKWKNVRFTIYSIIAGYLIAEGVENLFHPDLILNDFWG